VSGRRLRVSAAADSRQASPPSTRRTTGGSETARNVRDRRASRVGVAPRDAGRCVRRPGASEPCTPSGYLCRGVELLGIPLDAERGRSRHVAEQRRRRDHGRARQVTEAADPHAVLPVAIDRRDRSFALLERIRTLAETRAAPRLADLPAYGAEHGRDRLTVEARLRVFDVALDPARPGKDDERFRRFLEASLPPGTDYERCLEQVVVSAIGAGTDESLVEGKFFLGDLISREGIPRGEGLGDKGNELRQVQRLVDVPRHLSAGLEAWIGQISNPFARVPVEGD